MIQKQQLPINFTSTPIHNRKLKFSKDNNFQVELKERVDKFFAQQGISKQAPPKMYLKSFIFLFIFFSSYIGLVFLANNWWQALLFSGLLGLVMAGIGFNVQHDASHQTYSKKLPWVNHLFGLSLELIGGSSYNWHWKHVIFHHINVNIVGHDNDLNVGLFGRLAPAQKHLPFHRFQHYYLWFLYGLMAIKWQLFDDFEAVITGKMGENSFPKPRNWDLVIFFAGKTLFISLAFILPLFYHPLWQVVLFYTITTFILGIVLSIVFQLAHAVEEAAFPAPIVDSNEIDNSWTVHQIETTVDFSRNNPFVSWFLGGLNFQVEHHVFPNVCHVHYHLIAEIVEETCQEFGIKYLAHKSFWSGMVSHYRWLKRMGMQTG